MLTDNGVKEIAGVLKKISKITSLLLRLISNQITDEGAKAVAEDLKKIETLEYLEIILPKQIDKTKIKEALGVVKGKFFEVTHE